MRVRLEAKPQAELDCAPSHDFEDVLIAGIHGQRARLPKALTYWLPTVNVILVYIDICPAQGIENVDVEA